MSDTAKTNGNGHRGVPITEQPLSPLQRAALEAAHHHASHATLSQVMGYYYGEELAPKEKASAQACISRARRGLIKRGLIEDVRGVFLLSLRGWDLADGWAREQPAPVVILANDRDLEDWLLIAQMRRVQTRRHAHRAAGGRRLRKPLIRIEDGRNIKGTYEYP